MEYQNYLLIVVEKAMIGGVAPRQSIFGYFKCFLGISNVCRRVYEMHLCTIEN